MKKFEGALWEKSSLARARGNIWWLTKSAVRLLINCPSELDLAEGLPRHFLRIYCLRFDFCSDALLSLSY